MSISFRKKMAEKDERLKFLSPLFKDVKDDDEEKHGKQTKNRFYFFHVT